jgi:peptidoglycan hydrolase CwlO-like protein
VVEEIRNMFCQIDAKITTADKKVEKDAEEMKYPRQENERLERKIKEQDERLKW